MGVIVPYVSTYCELSTSGRRKIIKQSSDLARVLGLLVYLIDTKGRLTRSNARRMTSFRSSGGMAGNRSVMASLASRSTSAWSFRLCAWGIERREAFFEPPFLAAATFDL